MIRFGIAGLGRIGKRHADALTKVSGAELVGVYDPYISDGPDNHFTELSEMISVTRPDVICVCTPNHLHRDISLAAINAGCSVVCEKPLALSSADAREMQKAARSKGVDLVCVLQNRYSAPASWLKSIVDDGSIGQVIQIQVNCFWNRDDRYFLNSDGSRHAWHGTLSADGGPLFTQFSHYVDLLIWLFDEIEVSDAKYANFMHSHSIDFEDTGKFDFSIPGGGIGVFQYSLAVWDRNQESSITLIGTKGSVELGGQYMNRVDYCHFQGAESPVFEQSNALDNHTRLLQNVTEHLAHGVPLDFDLTDAVKGIGLIEEAYSMRDLSAEREND